MAQRVTQVRRPRPGQHALPREFIAQHQRARIVAALAEEAVDKGYRAVTVADVVRRAGIARNTFYENFASKEDCFLAAYEFAVEEAMRRVVEAGGELESWPARVNAGLAAFLRYVASEPALAHTCVVEALSAGPAAVERREQSIQEFVPLFRMGRKVSPQGEKLPPTLEEQIVGGLFWILYQRIVSGKVEEIEALRPELVEFALGPYIGSEAARRSAAEAPAVPAVG